MVPLFMKFWKSKCSSAHAQHRTATPRRRIGFDSLEARTLLALAGPEFHVNSDTIDDQDDSATACSSNGACVVAWSSYVNGDFDIRAQIFDAGGVPVGGEIVVADTLNDEFEPAVAMDSEGYFVVAWTVDLGSEADIRAQQFTPLGARFGGVIFVESSFLAAYDASVAMSASGDFVVAYTLDNPDADVIAKMYNNDGTLFRQLNVAVSGYDEHSASVASADDGRFAVAYQIDSSSGYNSDIRLRRYTELGGSLGTLRVSSTRSRIEANPSVAMDNFGNAAVAYEVFVNGDWDIHARQVSKSGRLGAILVVQDYVGVDETRPAIAMDRGAGDFVIAYETGPGYDRSTEVAEFSALGAWRGTFDLGTNRDRPSIGIDGSGFYLVAYTSFDRADDPDAGIFARFGQL